MARIERQLLCVNERGVAGCEVLYLALGLFIFASWPQVHGDDSAAIRSVCRRLELAETPKSPRPYLDDASVPFYDKRAQPLPWSLLCSHLESCKGPSESPLVYGYSKTVITVLRIIPKSIYRNSPLTDAIKC